MKLTMRKAQSSFALLMLVLSGALSTAQELPHPLEMKLPASSFQRPSPSDYQYSLDNGLVSYFAVADQVPLVTLSAFIKAGKASDSKQGIAEALLNILRHSGSVELSGSAFKKTLEEMTADYSVEMHDEWTEISINVPTDDLDNALSIFSSLIRSPNISPGNIENAALGARPSGQDDLVGEDGPALYEGSLAAAVAQFYRVLYANHPYGVLPTAEEVAAVTVADVQAFHKRYFVPTNMTIAIAGDIEPALIRRSVAALFGDIDKHEAPAAKRFPPIRNLKRSQHNFPVERLQSWLVFGHELPTVSPGESAAVEVMNYILAGGHLWTRMTVETRYKYGYTNDASGFLEDKWFGPGSYTFRSYSRPEVIRPIYENMMEEIVKIRSEKVSEEDLLIAKGALTDGNFQILYLDGYAIARNFALEKLRYGNHDRSSSYIRRVRSVTSTDVLNAAKKYIRPESMQVVLVGTPVELVR